MRGAPGATTSISNMSQTCVYLILLAALKYVVRSRYSEAYIWGILGNIDLTSDGVPLNLLCCVAQAPVKIWRWSMT